MNSGFKTLCQVALGLCVLYGWAAPAGALVGQEGTCGQGPQNRVVNLTAIENVVELGNGLKTQAWTFDKTIPGPVIEACEGDTVRVVMKNDGALAHGIDSHAFKISHQKFGPVEQGKTLAFEKKLDTPGVYMYHCAAGLVTDQHIKMGMYGVMIVYPRALKLQPARELAIAEGGVYGEPDGEGVISPSGERMDENRPAIVLYNGKATHDPVKVKAGERIRVYFVHVGPGSSAFHVIGTILDQAYEGGNPRNVVHGVQTYNVAAGSGGMFEFTLPEPGSYLLVDHNLLSQVPNGLVIPFVAE